MKFLKLFSRKIENEFMGCGFTKGYTLINVKYILYVYLSVELNGSYKIMVDIDKGKFSTTISSIAFPNIQEANDELELMMQFKN